MSKKKNRKLNDRAGAMESLENRQFLSTTSPAPDVMPSGADTSLISATANYSTLVTDVVTHSQVSQQIVATSSWIEGYLGNLNEGFPRFSQQLIVDTDFRQAVDASAAPSVIAQFGSGSKWIAENQIVTELQSIGSSLHIADELSGVKSIFSEQAIARTWELASATAIVGAVATWWWTEQNRQEKKAAAMASAAPKHWAAFSRHDNSQPGGNGLTGI